MTAPARRDDAVLVSSATSHRGDAEELWHRSVQIRQEWLDVGLSTEPADRATAERCVADISSRISRPRPRFEWVDSPAKALPLVAGWPTLDDLYRWIRDPLPPGRPPLVSDLATVVARLRAALSAGVTYADPELSPARQPGKTKEPWPDLPPREALARGVPLPVVLHRSVRGALHRSLGKGFRLPVRAGLGPEPPVCWYGQQDACWIGYYDALRRLGLARHDRDTTNHFGQWVELARSCGWWWPGADVCVLVDRPAVVSVVAMPGSWHDEVTVSAVAYRDGWHL